MTASAPRDKTHEPQANNAYFTIDPRPIPALLKHVTPRGVVWECAAGGGNMVGPLATAGHRVYATDIKSYPAFNLSQRRDFFDFTFAPRGDIASIVTNPPNDLNKEFAAHAIKLMQPVNGLVALYQRHEWDTAGNTAAIFDHPAYAMKITCRFRPRWFNKVPGEKSNSPFHKFSWYVWDWQKPWDGHVGRFA